MNRDIQPSQTEIEYRQVISFCKALFDKKNKDYGTSWRILRLPSLTDQIFIKAQRIRSIQEKGQQKIQDGIEGEFIGIINYCIIALIQKSLENSQQQEFSAEEIGTFYDQQVDATLELLLNKNHDYGEAWRDMRIESMTDLILMKIFRTKQIEDNLGFTLVSEGVEANYQDMLNYAVFCLIKGKNEQMQSAQQ
jgi:Nucleotide modification associated domain 1